MPVVNQKRPVGCPRSVHTPFAHRAPWLLPSQLVKMPATSPASLIARPELVVPQPSGYPRSVITPSCQRKAWDSPEPIVLQPTTWPASLRSVATLRLPPRSVPRSRIAEGPVVDGGAENWTVRVGWFADSLDS